MREIVAVQDLKVGMFIADLDRPWLETPFPIQGFLMEDEEQLGQLRAHCRFVYVDRTRSVGEHRVEPVKRAPPPRRPRPRAPVTVISAVEVVAEKQKPTLPVPDFFTILRELRGAKSTPKHEASRASWSGPLQVARGRPVPARSQPVTADVDAAVAAAPVKRQRSPAFAIGAGGLFARLADLFKGDPNAALAEAGTEASVHAVRAQFRRAADDVFEEAYPTVTGVEEELVTVAPVFQEASVVVEKLLHDVQRSATPDLQQVTTTVSTLVQSVVRNPDALIWLTRLKRTDQYAFDHALDVSVHLMLFGRFLGLPEHTLEMLGTVGLMQDVGLVNLPPQLLQKSGPLAPAEMKMFAQHVQHSMDILRSRCNVSEEIIEVVSRHHERVDGKGYPHGLKGDEIGLYGEMAGIVDTYCAMLSQRPYRGALSSQNAMEKINRLRNRKFSDSLVDQFIQCLGLYPVGTLVELESGEVAVVIAQNRIRRLKPKIMILLGPDKSALAYPTTVDLLLEPPSPTGKPYAISQALPSDAYGIDPKEYFLA